MSKLYFFFFYLDAFCTLENKTTLCENQYSRCTCLIMLVCFIPQIWNHPDIYYNEVAAQESKRESPVGARLKTSSHSSLSSSHSHTLIYKGDFSQLLIRIVLFSLHLSPLKSSFEVCVIPCIPCFITSSYSRAKTWSFFSSLSLSVSSS